jgi:hypothetical protein
VDRFFVNHGGSLNLEKGLICVNTLLLLAAIVCACACYIYISPVAIYFSVVMR